VPRRGNPPRSAFPTGYKESKDAESAEALTIALLNTVLKQAGLDELTNGTRGNHAGFLPLARHFKFVTSEKLVILRMQPFRSCW
jgi:hypothetical protein